MSTPRSTPVLRSLSLVFGWLADRRLPRSLRKPVYRLWALATRSDLSEVLLPLEGFPSLGAFFVRQLAPGARPFPPDPELHPSPVDGTVQSVDRVERGTILQAKGRPYGVDELLDGVAEDLEWEGGTAITIYLAPRDYHRIHCPEDGRLEEVHWVEGARYSVNPRVLAARERVLSINERVVLRLSSPRGPYVLVLVGALNVGRIRVVGVGPGGSVPTPSPEFGRGDELARFEMGSTVVVLWPKGALRPLPELVPGRPVRMGEPLGRPAG